MWNIFHRSALSLSLSLALSPSRSRCLFADSVCKLVLPLPISLQKFHIRRRRRHGGKCFSNIFPLLSGNFSWNMSLYRPNGTCVHFQVGKKCANHFIALLKKEGEKKRVAFMTCKWQNSQWSNHFDFSSYIHLNLSKNAHISTSLIGHLMAVNLLNKSIDWHKPDRRLCIQFYVSDSPVAQ